MCGFLIFWRNAISLIDLSEGRQVKSPVTKCIGPAIGHYEASLSWEAFSLSYPPRGR